MGTVSSTRPWWVALCRRCGVVEPFRSRTARNRWATSHQTLTGHPVVLSLYPADYRGDEVTMDTIAAAAAAREARRPWWQIRRWVGPA